MHKKHQGEGYKMKEHLTVDTATDSRDSEGTKDGRVEVIGQMFIDDSNRVA